MSEPVGYLLTWTCYGTWLPGDARGCVDIRHNTPGEEFAPANDWRQRCNAAHLKHAPISLGAQHRPVVQRTIVDHCEIRNWTLHAVNVRSNHVHVVVSCPCPPDIARAQFKSWATRRLRASGYFGKPTIVWTEDGSSRYLWNDDDLRAAISYVSDGQGPDLALIPGEDRRESEPQAQARGDCADRFAPGRSAQSPLRRPSTVRRV